MNDGFFTTAQVSGVRSTTTIPRCGLCGLYRTCQTPRMKPTGDGEKGILVIAEAPGETEDEKGIQLIGKAGRRLRDELKPMGCRLDRDCWKTNSCCCRPPKNRKPTDKEIASCRPNVLKAIKKYKPHTIILLGATAIDSLIPVVWKEEKSITMNQWLGWDIPDQKFNAWICPTFHPSFVNRANSELVDRLFRRHLRHALRHAGRPFDVLPDRREGLEIIARPSMAAREIRRMIGRKPITFDFEANCLKPEEEGSEIVCCSVNNSDDRTISYPWEGEAIDATAELLRSDTPKIGANAKFETRWTKAKLGFWIKGWIWDCMVAAHVLDNRSGITSVKFNAYILNGTPDWSSAIEPYLKPEKGEKLNRIREIPIMELMEYNAIDSREERKIYKKQVRMMKRITK